MLGHAAVTRDTGVTPARRPIRFTNTLLCKGFILTTTSFYPHPSSARTIHSTSASALPPAGRPLTAGESPVESRVTDLHDHESIHADAVRDIEGKGLYSAYMSFLKIKSTERVLAAARHNLREIQAEAQHGGRIDPDRTCLNTRLAGASFATGVAALARGLIACASKRKTVRKDAVLCLEFMISLPSQHTLDEDAFFGAALSWLARRFGGHKNVVSAVVHRDEASPHMHVLLVPLIGGCLQGSTAIGGPPQLRAFYEAFDSEVAEPFGLDPAPRKLNAAERERAAGEVFAELHRRKDACLSSQVWPILRAGISKDPLPAALILGIDVQRMKSPRRLRSFTDIMISKGKGGQCREAGA